jgi:hypothetical protein
MSERAARLLLDLPFHPEFANLSPSAVMTAIGLLKFTNGSAEAWPSQQTLCEITGISSKNTIKLAERQLEDFGILKTKYLTHGMRGIKYKFLGEPQRTLPVVPDLKGWDYKKIRKGHYGFSPPSQSNLAFYAKQTILLPTLTQVEMLLKEHCKGGSKTIQEMIQESKGIPAKLFGFILAIYLGDPWNLLKYSSWLKEDLRLTDDLALENTLHALRKEGYINEGNKIRNRSKFFWKVFSKSRIEFEKQFLKRKGFNYLDRGIPYHFPKLYISPLTKDSEGTEQTKQKLHRNFRYENDSIYSPGYEWIKKHKKMVIDEESINAVANFSGEIICSAVAYVAERLREEHGKQFPD